jgi:DNA (cytosine-5)-methyltransferase 1
MSDVWRGKCSKDIGFTLRVGGRGSTISDRRNWDSYLVDGVEKRISPEQGKKMQGFPEDFIFPVSEAQAMKQLGNSVAVPAVQATAGAIIDYLSILENTKRNLIC